MFLGETLAERTLIRRSSGTDHRVWWSVVHTLNQDGLHSQTPPTLGSGRQRGLRDVALSRVAPGPSGLDKRHSPAVYPTVLPATRRATRPTAFRSCLVAGFACRAGGCRRSVVRCHGAPVLPAPRVGGHAQSCTRDLPTACRNADYHAMAQRENQPCGQRDSGAHRDSVLARRVLRPLDPVFRGTPGSDRLRGKQPAQGRLGPN